MIDFFMIHGFLGRGSDWDPLVKELKKHYKGSFFRQPDLFFQVHEDLTPELSPSDWGNSFNAWARQTQATLHNRKRVLMGYSMGGRLGLHALLQRQGEWDAAVIMSANPGVEFEGESREARKKWEQDWAMRFIDEDWGILLELWNAQEIFLGDKQPFQLPEDQFSRSDLSYAIENWSPLEHGFELEDLKKLHIPVLWMVGEKDTKYLRIYQFLKDEKYIDDFQVIPNAGHRLLRSKDPEVHMSILLFLSQFF